MGVVVGNYAARGLPRRQQRRVAGRRARHALGAGTEAKRKIPSTFLPFVHIEFLFCSSRHELGGPSTETRLLHSMARAADPLKIETCHGEL